MLALEYTQFITADEEIMSLPNCPKCDAEYTYEDGALLVCPMCAHEWTAAETDAAQAEAQDAVIRDAVGNELQDGDTVTVIKDLKVKGSSTIPYVIKLSFVVFFIFFKFALFFICHLHFLIYGFA